MACAKFGDRIARHNTLRDVLYDAAAGAALNPAREVRHLLPGTDARPGDVFIPRWVKGRDAALDVTVTSPLAACHVAGAASVAGSALVKAVDRKTQGAAEQCHQQGLEFLPMAVETLGGLHKVAVDQVKQLAAALARQSGRDENEVSRHLFQSFSLNLMKGNAALLLGRRPDGDFLEARVDGEE